MPRAVAAFLVTVAGGLGLFALGRFWSGWPLPFVYGSLIALGAVAALVGRGPSGLLAFYLGYGVAHLLAIGLGLALPPSEAEVLERLFYQAYSSVVGTIGYLGPVLVRALLRRTRRPT
jgi:hypothetical protein